MAATTNGVTLTSLRTYDTLNRMVEFDDGLGNSIKYGYYLNGRLSTLTYPGGKTVSYTYDDFGRLSTVVDWAGRTTTYFYDNASRLTDIRRPNGTTTHRIYDANGRIVRNVDYSVSGAVIHFENLTYDADGRMVQSFLNPANPAFTLPTDALSFDADNRLSSWNAQAVAMDNDGNMTSGPLPDGTIGAYLWDGRSRCDGFLSRRRNRCKSRRRFFGRFSTLWSEKVSCGIVVFGRAATRRAGLRRR